MRPKSLVNKKGEIKGGGGGEEGGELALGSRKSSMAIEL